MKNNNSYLIWDLKIQNMELKFIFNNEVFVPSATSLFVAQNFKIKPGETVFDVGTGCGFFALLGSKMDAKVVYASETDKNALKLASKNFQLNNVNNIEILHSTYFGNGKKKVNVIVSNLPQFPIPYTSKNQKKKWKLVDGGGKLGNGAVKTFLIKSLDHLLPKGRVYFPLVYISNPYDTLKIIKKYYRYKIIASQDVTFSHYNYAAFKLLSELKSRKLSEFYKKDNVYYFKEELYLLEKK